MSHKKRDGETSRMLNMLLTNDSTSSLKSNRAHLATGGSVGKAACKKGGNVMKSFLAQEAMEPEHKSIKKGLMKMAHKKSDGGVIYDSTANIPTPEGRVSRAMGGAAKVRKGMTAGPKRDPKMSDVFKK